jgi:hypothetical protein
MINNKNLIPIIVFHVNGNQDYFKKCIQISSSKNKVYLIGDNSNMTTFSENNNVEFIHINDLESGEIKDFKKCFTNYSTNKYDYELYCFLRIFYLKSFFIKTKY